MDRREDVRLDQPQPPAGPRFRTLRHNRRRIRPPRHDPHHAQASCCCKRLVMNPNFPDGLLGKVLIWFLSTDEYWEWIDEHCRTHFARTDSMLLSRPLRSDFRKYGCD